ncbi:MAG: ImmA/IrrE family metallo-endopeptidase [Lachnospiraceae bacterium]|nr:ImmA/IrrE family metallo-endopeptidase [Lachnospiraceae bacterium]
MKNNIIEFQEYRIKRSDDQKGIFSETCKERRQISQKLWKRESQKYTSKYVSRDRKRKIEHIVSRLLRGNDMEAARMVDIASFVKSQGFLVQKAHLPAGTIGFLVVNDMEYIEGTNTHKWIVIDQEFANAENEIEMELKQSRFVTAHVYGHYILHKKDNTTYACKNTGKSDSFEDLEADYFARSILMPRTAFQMVNDMLNRLRWKETDAVYELKAEYLSDIFKVPQKEVQRRLEDLLEISN